ncbi:MAG: tRNA (adenosine(37)-N6)-threonylcarbamoyltransferase complex ATPase subunit type 1 TsaE [Patescibacteria group bacterium]
MKKTTQNAQESSELAKELYESHPNHKIWLLYGELGAGKTTFVKGLGEIIGMKPSEVKSPTYVLVNEYEHFKHYDLYRIDTMDDLTLEQLEEHLAENKRLVIEWPEKVEKYIKKPHLRIYIRHGGGDSRFIEVEAVD